MARVRPLCFGAAVLVSTFAPSCTRDDGPNVSVVTRLTAPRALLGRATRLELRVLEGNVTCDDATGAATFPSGESAAREVARSDLGTDCAEDVRFCGSINVEKS